MYIALGTFMTAAALLEVDICTIKDMINIAFECVINLADTPYRSCIMCAAGCRNSSVTFTSPAKVCYTPAELIKRR